MKTAHLESAFESEVVAHLLQHGWHQGNRTAYRRELGLEPTELLAFLQATQPQSWDKLVALHGSTDKAQQRLSKRIADELTSPGTVDVLRRGVTDLGVHVDLLYAEPAQELTPELRELYDENRCTVVRQLAHSESNAADAVDLSCSSTDSPSPRRSSRPRPPGRMCATPSTSTARTATRGT